MRNTSLKGHIAETAVLKELVKRGFKVSIPFGDYRYDMVAEKNGQFSRIQVKYVSWITKRGTIQVVFHSITRNGRRKYHVNDVDCFVAYHEPANKYYIIPFRDVKDRLTVQLRLGKPGNNQRSKITFATQYEDRWDFLHR